MSKVWKKKIRKTAALVLCTAMIASLGACGGSPDDSSGGESQETKDESEKIELTVWARDSIIKATQAAADTYNAQSDTVHVNVVEQAAAQFNDQFVLALSAQEAPDIVSVDCVLVPYYASIDALADVTDKFESLDYKDTFSEGMVELGTYDDKVYGIPFAPDVSVLLYNKDHYIEAGLDPEAPPEDWDELIEYSQKLTTDDRYGYVYTGGDAGGMMFTFMPYVWNNGGGVLSDDGKTSRLNESGSIAAIEMMYDMTHKYQVTPSSVTSYSWGEAQDAFLTGKASQIVLGSAAIYSFISGEHDDMNWGSALIPKGPDGSGYASFSGGDSIAIVSQSPHAEEAWDFIQHALSEEIQVEYMAKDGLLPARSDLFDNEYFNSNEAYSVLRDALEVGRAPYSLNYNEMYAPILEGLQNALNGEKTAAEAMDEASEKINKLME